MEISNNHPPSPGLVYASQSHLNNASNSSVSTSRTGVTPGIGGGVGGGGVGGGAVNLLHSTTLSPSSTPRSKVGIYGWRKRCLYLLILVILVVSILNLALTIWIIRVVGLTADGLGSLQIGADSVRISGDAEFLGAIHASEIRGVGQSPLVVEAAKELRLETAESLESREKYVKEGGASSQNPGASLVLKEDQIRVSADDFWVQNCDGETLFRARKDAEIEIGAGSDPAGVNVVGEGGATFVDGVQTLKIAAPSSANLDISSRTNRIDVFGEGGVDIAAKSGGISLYALDDISIASERGKLKLDADIQMIDLPLVDNRVENSKLEAHQLCVCENGRLFLAAARDACLQDSGVCA